MAGQRIIIRDGSGNSLRGEIYIGARRDGARKGCAFVYGRRGCARFGREGYKGVNFFKKYVAFSQWL